MNVYCPRPLALSTCKMVLSMRQIASLLFFLVTPQIANAVVPPSYLSVAQFRYCLQQKDMGNYSVWCVPPTRATRCPKHSWQQLQALRESGELWGCKGG